MARSVRERIIDAWTWYRYKPSYDLSTHTPYEIRSWVPRTERGRLLAYQMLEAYVRNSARWWLRDSMSDEDRRDRREYGDANILIQTTMNSILGDNPDLWVDGAVEQGNNAATQQADLLRTWMDQEMFWNKVIESERQSIKLGDSVYVLGVDEVAGRPRLQVYDPGFYFPVFDPSSQGAEQFPGKVNIVWEYEEPDANGTIRRYVRRLQWFLDIYDGGATVSLPWNAESTNVTCIYSDGVWELDNLGEDPNIFDEGRARWNVPPSDLGLDFIPVIHIPNTVAIQEHFGTSVLAPVMQLLDDISATDTDIQKSGSIAGTPPIALGGVNLPKDTLTYGPGTVLQVGDGTATVLDSSTGLHALVELKDALLERLSVNARIPEALLGRVKPNEVPSGIALTLSFTPHSGLVREARLARTPKYQLLFKFVGRIYMKLGALTELADAKLVFGSFLPADKQETMTLVVQLYTTKAISLETAVKMLVASGFPIDDYVLEIERIMAEDFSSASQLLDLTGDMNLVRARLGLPPLSDAELAAEQAAQQGQDPNAL